MQGDKKPVVMESDRAVPSGIATLDSVGNVPFEQLGNVVRPNLLINPYFVNPVNQRGQTEYVSPSYAGVFSVDRWRLQYKGAKMEVTTDGLKATVGEGANFMMRQDFEAGSLLQNTRYTFSILTDIPDVTLMFWWNGAQQLSETIGQSFTFKTPNSPCTSAAVYIQKGGSAGEVLGTIKAAKLELGSTQTLAHQDADGNWVLNEIPDYGEELRKCQRYQRVLSAESAYSQFGVAVAKSTSEAYMIIDTAEMRSKPEITASGTFMLYDGSNYEISSITKSGQSNRTAPSILITSTGLTAGKTYILTALNDSSAKIILDANL